MGNIETIHKAVLEGDATTVIANVEAALKAGVTAHQIMQEGLIAAMTEVGTLFENQEFYVPEMLVAARAMQSGLAILKPHLVAGEITVTGKVVLGTVKGDLHNIGKNLVGMMLEGAGFEIIDLGTDVSPESFAEAVRTYDPNLVALSALLTTTMQNMRSTINALKELPMGDHVRVMVGGAPVTEAFAKDIGADGYAPDASRAVTVAKDLIAVH